MIWLSSATESAPSLPAAWLIETGQNPANLIERSQLRRSTACRIIATQTNLALPSIAIDHDPRGRPVLARPIGTGLHLSLATRSGLVAVALAHAPVGVDVERIDPLRPAPIAVLHPSEQKALLDLAEVARPLAFAQIWAGKEAYVKALGTGFTRPPESFVLRLVGESGLAVDDPDEVGATGTVRILSNGGDVTLAAAIVVLG